MNHSGSGVTNQEIRHVILPSDVTSSDTELRPEDFPPEVRAYLAEVDKRAIKTVQYSRPKSTRNGYEQDWRTWERFCREHNLPLLAVEPGTLVWFVEWAWTLPGKKAGTFMAPATIDRKLSGIVVTARSTHRLPLSKEVARDARTYLAALVEQMKKSGEKRGYGQAAALLIDDMQKISNHLPNSLAGTRDRALMTLHFAVAGREHELAWLRLRDITFDPHDRGLLVDIQITKTEPRLVKVLYGSRPSICPVRCWRAWLTQSGITDPDGPAFRQLRPYTEELTKNALSPVAVGGALTRAGVRANVKVRLTGHSPRRGLVTESLRKKRDPRFVEKQGGWKKGSRVVAQYREDADGWDENALTGVL